MCLVGPQVTVGHNLVMEHSGGWPWGLRKGTWGWSLKPGATLALAPFPIGDTGAQQTARSGPESWLLHSFDRHSCALRGCEDECVLDPDFERPMVWQGSLAATLGPGWVGAVVVRETSKACRPVELAVTMACSLTCFLLQYPPAECGHWTLQCSWWA